jgi:tRNA (mo5U34)-methyltransferase
MLARMDVGELLAPAAAFEQRLAALKDEIDLGGADWYPYGSMGNFAHLDSMLTGSNRDVLRFADGRPILDIGAADGDTAFFLESLGQRVHVLENPPTNYNHCRGIHAMRTALESRVEIAEVDLDSQFVLPEGQFGLAFLLGLLYHLKNPYFVLETLAGRVEHMLLSTRVAQYNVAAGREDPARGINAARVDISTIPAGYLVAPDEANNDATNFWMFTQAGLRRILDRTGWDVLDYATLGVTDGSDPATSDHDERAFCLLRSRAVARSSAHLPPLRGGLSASRGSPADAGDDLDRIAGEPTWMYEFDLGAGVRTATIGPELMDVHRTRAAVIEPVVRAELARLEGAPATALDLACSEGWFAHRLLDWGVATVECVDIRAENTRRAALVRDRLGIDAGSLRLRTADVFELDLAVLGTFDVVLCLGLIYHLENPVGALRIARALTRGVCIVESQLTEQVEPIRHGSGQTGQFMEQDGSWAAYLEPPNLQEGYPIASYGGVISLLPNRAALLQAMQVAGFSRVEALVPARGNPQYVDGHRLVVAGWP